MSAPTLQLRPYAPEDHAMILEWCQAHGHAGMPQAVLPKLGAICQIDGEDAAAMWLYMDNSVGVCFAEYAITRPKLKTKQAKDALLCILGFLKLEAAANGYSLMIVHTFPAIARYLAESGFTKQPSELVALWNKTQEEA